MASRKQFLLRLDPALYAELEAWAAGELRSVNGQMEYLLRQAVAARKGGRRVATAGGSAAPSEKATGGEPGVPSKGTDVSEE
jgi:hypothetical protein